MEASQAHGEPLEDRLRSLILTNSENPESHPADNSQKTQKVGSGKKRPNQAQRRQMIAEYTIPIDPRGPMHPSPRQHTRPQYHNHPQQGQQQQHQFQSNSSAYPNNSRDQTRRDHVQPSTPSSTHQNHKEWKTQQHPSVDAQFRGVNFMPSDTISSRGGRRQIQPQATFYKPGRSRQMGFPPEQLARQSAFLDQLCHKVIAGAEIEPDEIAEKENFRMHVEAICREVVTRYEYETHGLRILPMTVELKCFGSLASGFATKAADMDLGLLSPMSPLVPNSPESPIPRLIEGALLAAGFGARLLARTRIPIIKLCEKPGMALRQSLLDARRKWEAGFDQDERDEDEEAFDDPDALLEFNPPIDNDPRKVAIEPQTAQSPTDVKPVTSYEDELSSFKQSFNQSLGSYYSCAKRLLRNLRGRDVTQVNNQCVTEADFILHDKVACAFVNGLYDVDLRSRILSYRSFNSGDTTQQKNYRSLRGVHTMIEGEKLVLYWETKIFSLRDPRLHQAYESIILRWKDLQRRHQFGTNPIWFDKELQLALEALRQIPLLGILQLKQDQYESPAQYYGRASNLVNALSTTTSSTHVDEAPQLLEYYVDGIRDENIKNKIRDLVASTGTQSIRMVARIHKSLHLATDYERALEKGLYRHEDVPVLQRYISILRRAPVPSTPRTGDLEYLIPIMRDETATLERIRQLPDPATLAPNKPRDRYNDGLAFPKSGVGVQCDVNFSAHLALHNTALLRCYSYTDHRVRPLVLFVKHWAKARGINTPYRGTLSSYGYVLMVLHYLVNVVEPFVCPNLQQLAPADPPLPPGALEGITTCQGHNIRFWKDEGEIQNLARQGLLNQNQDSLGTLLRGFFEYYALTMQMTTMSKRGFDWGRDVISLRTFKGLLSKQEKGWVGARTVLQKQTGASSAAAELDITTSQSPDGLAESLPEPVAAKSKDLKEIRNRYLFAIEDPFELNHNVARTVTHNGIVAIRDEFRRAWRIIKAAGLGEVTEDLLEDKSVCKEQEDKRNFMLLLSELHGDGVLSN